MAPRKLNKTDPRNKATPVDRLKGAAKQARITKVTKAEAKPGSIKAGPWSSAGSSGGRTKTPPKGPQLPPTPKKPTSGTMYTIRATGGRSTDPKINRLSAQTKPITGNRPIAPYKAPQRPSAAANVAKSRQALQAAGARASRLAGKVGAVGVGTNLFMQGKSGSEIDQLAKRIPGMKANPKTDLGKRAGDAITRTASQAAASLKKQLKKAKIGY